MDIKTDFKKCYDLLKDYEFYMWDMPCPICGEDNLDEIRNFIKYLEKTYPELKND